MKTSITGAKDYTPSFWNLQLGHLDKSKKKVMIVLIVKTGGIKKQWGVGAAS